MSDNRGVKRNLPEVTTEAVSISPHDKRPRTNHSQDIVYCCGKQTTMILEELEQFSGATIGFSDTEQNHNAETNRRVSNSIFNNVPCSTFEDVSILDELIHHPPIVEVVEKCGFSKFKVGVDTKVVQQFLDKSDKSDMTLLLSTLEDMEHQQHVVNLRKFQTYMADIPLTVDSRKKMIEWQLGLDCFVKPFPKFLSFDQVLGCFGKENVTSEAILIHLNNTSTFSNGIEHVQAIISLVIEALNIFKPESVANGLLNFVEFLYHGTSLRTASISEKVDYLLEWDCQFELGGNPLIPTVLFIDGSIVGDWIIALLICFQEPNRHLYDNESSIVFSLSPSDVNNVKEKIHPYTNLVTEWGFKSFQFFVDHALDEAM